MRHFLRFKDFSRAEHEHLFERTRVLKHRFKNYIPYQPLTDRMLAMVFEKSSTRAINLWAGAGAYDGLGKGAFEWVKSTATEAAAKLAVDPALIAVRDEIDFYFPGQAPDRGDSPKP